MLFFSGHERRCFFIPKCLLNCLSSLTTNADDARTWVAAAVPVARSV